MKISVNILCWNNLRCLKQTLKVLAEELKGIKHEVIVVDNASSDGTEEYEPTQKNVTMIHNNENRGISHGKNQGVEISKGKYIMLLDGDIIPIPGTILRLMEFLEKTKDADAIGFYPNKFSNQLNKNGQKHHEEYCENLYNAQPHNSHCIYYGLYRREIFDTLRFCTDGASGEAGYGWEDFDFYNQMVRAGFSQWAAHINHAKGKYFHDINSSIRIM